MKNISIEKRAENLKKLIEKPKSLLKRLEIVEKQIKTLQIKVVSKVIKNNNSK